MAVFVKCFTTEIMFSTKAFGQENGKPNKHADIHYISVTAIRVA